MRVVPPFETDPYRRWFAGRLHHQFVQSGLSQTELAGRLRPLQSTVSRRSYQTLVSAWLKGQRAPTARHLQTLVRALFPASQTKHQQEISDWYGLLGYSLPAVVALPVLTLPPLSVTELHRPQVVHDIVGRLFAPHAETAAFTRQGVALTGLPGSGKRTLAHDVAHCVRPFFCGGVVFADLQTETPTLVLQRWAVDLHLPITAQTPLWQVAVDLRAARARQPGRWLCVLHNVPLSVLPDEFALLLADDLWCLLTTAHYPTLQGLRVERWNYPMPPLTPAEAETLLAHRLGARWDRYNDPRRAKALWQVTEGWPLALSLLASQVHARGWADVTRRLVQTEDYPALFQVKPGDVPEKSLAVALKALFESLSPTAMALLARLAGFAPGQVIPLELTQAHSPILAEDATGLYELRESGLLHFDGPELSPESCLRLPTLVGPHVLARQTVAVRRIIQHELARSLLTYLARGGAHDSVFANWCWQAQVWPHLQHVWTQGLAKFDDDTDATLALVQRYLLVSVEVAWAVGGIEVAVAWLQRVVRDDLPKHPAWQAALGPEWWLAWVDLHFAMNELQAAEWGLRQCQAVVSASSSMWSARLWARQLRLYVACGEQAQAAQHLAAAAALTDSPAQALAVSECQLARGQCSLARGEFALAYQAFSAALQAIRVAWEFQSDISTTIPKGGDLRMALYWTLEQVLVGWRELYARTNQRDTAIAFTRQAVRLLMLIPSTQILEALYVLAEGVREQGDEASARQIMTALQQGEVAMAQTPVRSEILAMKLAHSSESPADQAAREQLARSLRHRGLGHWIPRLDVGAPTEAVVVSVSVMSNFSPSDFLAQWAEALHAPNFASVTAPLPETWPWEL